MKILILSDSHAGLSFMRTCVRSLTPDAVIHLGDYLDDALVIAEENPDLVVHRVPGNCDRYRCPPETPAILCYPVGGVRLYMTHGHLHKVKYTMLPLLQDARAEKADAVLYGHTHSADCHREPDGLWVINPGSCGSSGGTVCLMETENGKITSCRILRQEDLEGKK